MRGATNPRLNNCLNWKIYESDRTKEVCTV